MSKKVIADPTPEEWMEALDEGFVENSEIEHPSRKFGALRKKARDRIAIEHEIVSSLGELRRSVGLNQTEVASRWGRGQSQVSKIERNPERAELATLAGYVTALGGHVSITIEIDNHVFYEELHPAMSPSPDVDA
ncbi:MAG: XRE family transcriptional regulator [Actinomycetota bacterium]|jgi:hypothetical protein|nr:XRE family transcriptional regulator [Actinomycetota bacterium]